MNRTHLIDAFAALSAAKGYHFLTLAAERVPTSIKSLPMVVLEPPAFLSIDGTKSGKIAYSVRLHLIVCGGEVSVAERYMVEAEAEAALLDLMTQLSADRVVLYLNDLKISPSAIGSTIGCTATAKVVTEF